MSLPKPTDGDTHRAFLKSSCRTRYGLAEEGKVAIYPLSSSRQARERTETERTHLNTALVVERTCYSYHYYPTYRRHQQTCLLSITVTIITLQYTSLSEALIRMFHTLQQVNHIKNKLFSRYQLLESLLDLSGGVSRSSESRHRNKRSIDRKSVV